MCLKVKMVLGEAVCSWRCQVPEGEGRCCFACLEAENMSPELSWSTAPAPLTALTRCPCTRTFPGNPLAVQGWERFWVSFSARASSLLLPAAEPAGVLFSKNTSWRAVFIAPGSVRAAEDESGFPAASVRSGGLALVLLSLTPSPSQPFSQCRAEIPQRGENPVEFQMSCS